jgi:hypothetical protein
VESDRSAAVRDAWDRGAEALRRGEIPAALRYYEYAQRLSPGDSEITLAIGAARLSQHDPCAAEAFARVATRDDVQEAWLGLAAAHHGMGEHVLAGQDLRALLSRHGHVRGTVNLRLHDAIALAYGGAGWCALSADGRLRVTLLDPAADMNRTVILRDGEPLGGRPRRSTRDGDRQRALFHLPNSWRDARHISICLRGRHLLGSPLEASVIGRVEGFVAAADGGLTGWAWFPGDPDCKPALTIQDAKGSTLRIVASDPAPEVRHASPLARPRRLDVRAADLCLLTAPLAVRDTSGRNIYGSPLDPRAEQRSAAGASELVRRLFPAGTGKADGAVDLRMTAVPADIVGVRSVAGRAARSAGIDVVIPVYGGRDRTLACIRSVLASLPADVRCIVVEDASPEAGLVDALKGLAEPAFEPPTKGT